MYLEWTYGKYIMYLEWTDEYLSEVHKIGRLKYTNSRRLSRGSARLAPGPSKRMGGFCASCTDLIRQIRRRKTVGWNTGGGARSGAADRQRVSERTERRCYASNKLAAVEAAFLLRKYAGSEEGGGELYRFTRLQPVNG